MRRRGRAAALVLLLALAVVACTGRPAAAQSCQPVTAEFVLTGLSNADGNSRNHELGICLPQFTLELTSQCRLTLKPQYANNAYVSLLQVGEPSPGEPIIPRATDSIAEIHDAITNKLGYYYLKPQKCPSQYATTIKGSKLLASDIADVIRKTLELSDDAGMLTSALFTQFGLTLGWRTQGSVPNEHSYTAIAKSGGPTMPDFQPFAGSTNDFCPLLDINPAPDFDVSPQDGLVDASAATLVGRVARAIPGRPGYFVCAIAPAGGYVKVRRNAGFANMPVQYAYTVDAPNTYVTCGAGGFLYKLGAVNAPGDAATDVCVACLRGSSATNGATLCAACAPGQYQDQMGQKTCWPCQYGYSGHEGAQRCMSCYYGRAYCSEGFSPNENLFTCNSARLPRGYSPEGGFAVVRPFTDPTNIDNARRYSRMFNACTIASADSLVGFNVSAECRVDMYVLGDVGTVGNGCSQNTVDNSVTAYYTAPNLLSGIFTKGIGYTRVGMHGALGPAGFSTTFFAATQKSSLPSDKILPTSTILGLTFTGWGYLGGGDNGLGANAGVRGVAADPCPPGTIKQLLNGDGVQNPGEDPNLLLADYCVPCGPGVFCDAAAPAPQNCPAGTFGAIIGAKNIDGCTDCPIGTFQDLDGQFQCQSCMANTFAAAPGATSCQSCGDGYEVSSVGSNMCNPCPAGMFRDSAVSEQCQECSPGTSSNEAASTCAVCEPGTFAATAKATFCAECPRGSFQNKYGQTSCGKCKPGSYQDARKSPKCKTCPLGTYNPAEGSDSATACLSCPMGSAGITPGAAKCTKCNPGYYTNRNGQASCTPCAVGFYAEGYGAERCQPCPKGHFTEVVGAKKCKQCDIGFYSAFSGSSKCLSCPPGSFTNTTGASACARCPAGTYSTRNAADSSITCVECPPGTFSYATGAQECLACPAGQYTDRSRSQACRECPLGTYAPAEGSQRCLPCKAGFTTTATGADSLDSCSVKVTLDGKPLPVGAGAVITVERG